MELPQSGRTGEINDVNKGPDSGHHDGRNDWTDGLEET